MDEWIVVFEGCDRVGKRFCTWSGGMRGGVSFLGDFPKSTAFPVTAGMSEGDFVVPDDSVVKVGHIQRSVGAESEEAGSPIDGNPSSGSTWTGASR